VFKRNLLAAAIVAGILGLASDGASASVISPQPAPTIDGDKYVPVATVVKKKKVVTNRKGKRVVTTTTTYSSAKHGPRYRKKTGRYVHYHNGYYYSRPWWIIAPGISISID
jgi:hypothetical protein